MSATDRRAPARLRVAGRLFAATRVSDPSGRARIKLMLVGRPNDSLYELPGLPQIPGERDQSLATRIARTWLDCGIVSYSRLGRITAAPNLGVPLIQVVLQAELAGSPEATGFFVHELKGVLAPEDWPLVEQGLRAFLAVDPCGFTYAYQGIAGDAEREAFYARVAAERAVNKGLDEGWTTGVYLEKERQDPDEHWPERIEYALMRAGLPIK